MPDECKYLFYRRCLLKDNLTYEPFATLKFCRENCKPNNKLAQKKMLSVVYGVKADEIPTPEALHIEYGKIEKKKTTNSVKPRPTRTKDNQAYLINYCGQVCGELHKKERLCRVNACKIKGVFYCPQGKWDSIDKKYTQIIKDREDL